MSGLGTLSLQKTCSFYLGLPTARPAATSTLLPPACLVLGLLSIISAGNRTKQKEQEHRRRARHASSRAPGALPQRPAAATGTRVAERSETYSLCRALKSNPTLVHLDVAEYAPHKGQGA
jgi:hypothetical protein